MCVEDKITFFQQLENKTGEGCVEFLKGLENQLLQMVNSLTEAEGFEEGAEPAPYIAVNAGVLQFAVVNPATGEEATFLTVSTAGELQFPYDDDVIDATPLTDEIKEACGAPEELTLQNILDNQTKITKIILNYAETYAEVFS